MFRFLFRLTAMVSLSVAVIMAVLDATRMVAASALVMTPLKTSWNGVSPETLGLAEMFVRDRLNPLVWDVAINWVLALPGFVVFSALAFLLYAIGYRRERPHVRHGAG